MSDKHERMCKNLVEQCKHEAKQLVEFTATRRKVHWTHPSFVSFCVSVEDILSYGVKRRYQSYRSKLVTSSGHVLHELGKSLPDAAAIYEKCFDNSSPSKEDYARVHSLSSTAERKIVWIRAALVEGKLQGIMDKIMSSSKQFYSKESVLCHPVYGEIFKYLIDGPCSIRYSRLKTSDAAMGTPSPAEIVERHSQVLSISSYKGKQDEGRGEGVQTEAAWDHVRSLYQSNASTCLFGKNNIMAQPAGFNQAIQGYLTLLQDGSSLMLKWIPNSLLRDSSNTADRSLWKTVMSVDIVTSIAHIHCHRAPGRSAELILIGYDGIAHPPLLFPHQPSFFLFLECLENSLLPQGCLEPPLWFIKDKTTKSKKMSPKNYHRQHPEAEEGEWFEAMEVWNQVFRIRYGPRPQKEGSTDDNSEKIHVAPPTPHALALNLSNYSGGSAASSESELSDSEEAEEGGSDQNPVEKPGSLARGDWEAFQSKVSRQLLARYFYSWLSHCRHMTKVRANVSHLVGPTLLTPAPPSSPSLDKAASSAAPVAARTQAAVSMQEWDTFSQSQNMSNRWQSFLKEVYFRGVDPAVRKKVWPYLLGLYPVGATEKQRAAILERATQRYNKLKGEWQQVEATKKEIELEAAVVGHRGGSIHPGSREHSPALSTISDSSPLHSPTNDKDDTFDNVCNGSHGPAKESHDHREESHDHRVESHDHRKESHETSHDGLASKSGDVVVVNGNTVSSESRDQPRAELTNHGTVTSTNNSDQDNSHDREPSSHDLNPEYPSSHNLSQDSLIVTPDPEELVMTSPRLDSHGRVFVKELYNIDKDVPRCDRDYWYFQNDANLQKVRNVVCSFVWAHLSEGYSQGMCDLLSPLLVVLEEEPLAYTCYLKLMNSAIKLFPPNTSMNTRLANVQALLLVMEPEFFQYLSERPLGDGLFYAYRWLLVTFKREFSYNDVFRLWETVWAARVGEVTSNFEEFVALAIMKQFKSAIMDARMDPSDILNLFTDLAEKRAIDGNATIRIAQETIHTLQADLARKDC